MRNRVITKINKKSVIVIPQGVPLILLLLWFYSFFVLLLKTHFTETSFSTQKIRKSHPHASHFFLPVLSLCLYLCFSPTLFLFLFLTFSIRISPLSFFFSLFLQKLEPLNLSEKFPKIASLSFFSFSIPLILEYFLLKNSLSYGFSKTPLFSHAKTLRNSHLNSFKFWQITPLDAHVP